MLIDAESKLVVTFLMGRRTAELAEAAFVDFACRTDGVPPELITSDEEEAYRTALLSVYGEEALYATVHKRRAKGRVVEVTRRTVIGTDRRLKQALKTSSASQSVNTSAIERFHGTNRHLCARKVRRTYTFSKDLAWHVAVGWLCVTAYNFCRFHRGLQEPIQETPSRYRHRTPAMAAGLTDRRWTLKDLLKYPLYDH